MHAHLLLLWLLSYCLGFALHTSILLLDQWVSTLDVHEWHMGFKKYECVSPWARDLEPTGLLGGPDAGIYGGPPRWFQCLCEGFRTTVLDHQLFLVAGSNTASFARYPSTCHRVWYRTDTLKSARNHVPEWTWGLEPPHNNITLFWCISRFCVLGEES